MDKFAIFKDVTIGGLTKQRLLQQLSDSSIQFNQYAHSLFEHPHFLPPTEIQKAKLVKLKLTTMGLKETCSIAEFENRVFALELKLCPLYLAAFLRLELLDQPPGPYLTIASRRPENYENYPNGFYIRNHDNVLWLRGYLADGFADWPGENEFIFCA